MLFLAIVAIFVWVMVAQMKRANEKYKKSPYYIETNNILHGIQEEREVGIQAAVMLNLRPKSCKSGLSDKLPSSDPKVK